MKHLQEHIELTVPDLILEDADSKAWNIDATWDDVVELCLKLNRSLPQAATEQIHNELLKCWNNIGEDESYKLRQGGEKFFKIPRKLEDELFSNYSEPINQVIYRNSAIYYILNNKEIKVAILGNGSKDTSLSVNEHEPCTCHFFNLYASGELNPDDPTQCKEVAENFLGKKLSADWLKTFPAHALQIASFLKESGVNYQDYEAVHMGKGEVGKAYKDFIDSYRDSLMKSTGISIKKDTVDPSDIVVYKKSSTSSIPSILKSISGKEASVALDEFKNKLFSKRLIVGVSLKQTSNKKRVPDIYNGWGDDMFKEPIIKVTSIQYHESQRSFEMKCRGQFKLGNMEIDDDGDLEGKENFVLLTLRSNQKTSLSGIAVDIKIGKHPSQGKVPVEVWRKYIKVDVDDFKKKSKTSGASLKDELMQVYREKLMEFLGVTKQNETTKNGTDAAAEMISAGIKQFPTCLPYILVN